ncbi:hypothetical protein K523DRAFT_72511 [Schizophyllum commune Tattone D]|nr:hypothetical protein K525DRAFT_244238 [Schizophyllum commune Loenen D]KAI5827335.1 hypothetical protein K523DRAFT_72511 [Schizophyllum commune Tattone D]
MNALSILRTARRARLSPRGTTLVASTSRTTYSPRHACVTIRSMSSAVPDDHPKDDKIPHRTVRIVAQDGVGPPTSLSTILAAIDRKNFFVELVSHHKETGALVKIIDKRERARWLKEQKQRAKAAKKPAPKEMQLTWATDGHDLEHKLSKVRKDLSRGARVDIALAQKSGQKELTAKEKQQKLQGIVDSLQDVSTEWKPREVRKHVATIYLESTVSPNDGDS